MNPPKPRVVSFYCPRPDHPFFQDYTPFLDVLRASCVKHGCEHRVLTDDASVGEDAYLVDVQHSLMRAFLEAQWLYLNDPANADVPTLLVGADCVLAGDPKCFQCGGDVVVTVDDRFTDCRINMGAVYVRRPADVAAIWADALARCGDDWGDDQRAFRDALAASNAFVVELPCDLYNIAPDHPGHDCSHAAVVHFRGPRKAWMVEYCAQWLGIGERVVLKVAANTPKALMLANAQVNIARGLEEVAAGQPNDDLHAVLVGGGPSLPSVLDEIKWRKSIGQTVFGMNGSVKWLHDHGVQPNYGVMLDPRSSNAKFLGDYGCRWLLASQCHPDIFALCPGKPKIWHFAEGVTDEIFKLFPAGGAPPMVCGGLTVGITAMALVHMMGFRKVHLYGYDSSDADGEGHAYSQSENDKEGARLDVWVDGRCFKTNSGMYAQASVFEKWALALADEGTLITVHGDGLLPAIAHAMQRGQLLQEAA